MADALEITLTFFPPEGRGREGAKRPTDRGPREGAPGGRSSKGPGGPKPEGPRLVARSFSWREGPEEPRPTEKRSETSLRARSPIPKRGRRPRQNLARSSRGGRRAWRPSARRPDDLLVGKGMEGRKTARHPRSLFLAEDRSIFYREHEPRAWPDLAPDKSGTGMRVFCPSTA